MIISQNEETIIPNVSMLNFDAITITGPEKDIDYYILCVIINGKSYKLGLFKKRSDAYTERDRLIKYISEPTSSDCLINEYD